MIHNLQRLAFSGTNLNLSISEGNNVDLSSLSLYAADGTTGTGRAVGITDTLNFDSNTFLIDGANNRLQVGAGTARPASLNINMAGTDDGIDIRQNSASSSERPLQIINASDSGVSLYINNTSLTNPQGAIRIDGAKPEIEFVENDQVSPVGKWEIQANGNDFNINSRNAADTGYEQYLWLNGSLANGGQMVLNARTSSATRDLFIINNKQSSAGARPGIAWENEVGAVTSARLSSSIGSSSSDAKFFVQVADNTKTLRDRFMIDVNGNVGIGTTSPSSKLEVANGNIAVSGTGLFDLELEIVTWGSGTGLQTAVCPADKFIVSGGCNSSGVPFDHNRPASSTVWQCRGVPSTSSVNAYALCGKVSY